MEMRIFAALILLTVTMVTALRATVTQCKNCPETPTATKGVEASKTVVVVNTKTPVPTEQPSEVPTITIVPDTATPVITPVVGTTPTSGSGGGGGNHPRVKDEIKELPKMGESGSAAYKELRGKEISWWLTLIILIACFVVLVWLTAWLFIKPGSGG